MVSPNDGWTLICYTHIDVRRYRFELRTLLARLDILDGLHVTVWLALQVLSDFFSLKIKIKIFQTEELVHLDFKGAQFSVSKTSILC